MSEKDKKLRDQAFSFILTEIDDTVPKDIFEDISKTVMYASITFYTQEDGIVQVFSRECESNSDFWETIIKLRPVGFVVEDSETVFKVLKQGIMVEQ